MKTNFVLTITLGALFGFCVAQETNQQPIPNVPEQTQKQALQGTWIAQSIETSGNQVPPEDSKRLRFTFKGDHLLISGNTSFNKEEDCTYKVDATKSPKQLEFTPPKEEKPVLGIYEVSGDDLKICFRHASSADGRPTEFRTVKDSNLVLVVFKRVTP